MQNSQRGDAAAQRGFGIGEKPRGLLRYRDARSGFAMRVGENPGRWAALERRLCTQSFNAPLGNSSKVLLPIRMVHFAETTPYFLSVR